MSDDAHQARLAAIHGAMTRLSHRYRLDASFTNSRDVQNKIRCWYEERMAYFQAEYRMEQERIASYRDGNRTTKGATIDGTTRTCRDT